MADTPTIEPTEIVKGETLKFKRTFSGYPASEWSCTYYFRGAGRKDVTAAADGDAFLVRADTSNWTAGDYWYQAKATKGGETYIVSTGALKVRPALSDVTGTYDGRSHVKKVLDAIEAVIENRASRTDLEYEIAGRRIKHMGPDELIKWHSHYKILYRRELRAERIKKGLGTGNKVLVRFR